MKYVATQRGYHGRIIEPGETFQYEGKPGLWMKPVAEEKSAETAATAKAAENVTGKAAGKGGK